MSQSTNSPEFRRPLSQHNSLFSLTDDQLETLLAHAYPKAKTPARERRHLRLRLLLLLMADAGLRCGEVAKLLTTDAYFNSLPVMSITVRPEIAKNAHSRTIPLSVRLREALSEYRLANRTLLWETPGVPLLTASAETHYISCRQIQRLINTASLHALGFAIHPHSLRHTFATRLMRVTDIRTVQELLGHVSVTSTQIYTHPSSQDKSNAIEKLNQLPDQKDNR